jgi:transcriptional regulator with XRE-family HTH domain
MNPQLQIPFSAGRIALAGELAATMRAARIRRNWSQYQAAAKMRCTQKTVSNLESVSYLAGDRRGFPCAESVRRACEVYRLPHDVIAARFSELRGMARNGGVLRSGFYVGVDKPKAKPASNVVPFPPFTIRDVDNFEFPDMIRFEKPGLERETLIAMLIWAAVALVFLYQLGIWMEVI